MATSCQICLDHVATKDVVTKICGDKCPAVCCSDCFQQHIKVSLASAFPGVLPKIKCPICLQLLHKSQWSHVLHDDDAMEITEQYKLLCNQACSFQSPCCHNADYTHLPIAFDHSTITNVLCANNHYLEYKGTGELMLLPSMKRQIPILQRHVRRFARHRAAPRDLINFIIDTFGEKSKLVFQLVLRRIEDEERRATLLLSYYAKYKNTATLCCGHMLCFNCKRRVHHEDPTVCDEDTFQEMECMLQCRGCQITLVKVDGCDSVRCVCGFDMSWGDEVQIRELLRKKLLPVDPFDRSLFINFELWRQQVRTAIVYHAPDAIFQLQTKRFANLAPSIRLKTRALIQKLAYYVKYRRMVVDVILASQMRECSMRAPRFLKMFRARVSDRIWRGRVIQFKQKLANQLQKPEMNQFVHNQHGQGVAPFLRSLVLTYQWRCQHQGFKRTLEVPLRKAYVDFLIAHFKRGSPLLRVINGINAAKCVTYMREQREDYYLRAINNMFG